MKNADEKTMKDIKRKTLSASVEEETDSGVVAKLTTDSVDRDGEMLIPQGMNSREYEKNPVLFYNHDYANPIGTVEKIKRGDRDVLGTLKFAQRPEGYQGDFFPEFVESLVRQGIIKGVSVGFLPENGGSRLATKGDMCKYGKGIKRVYNKWKLLEVSIAPLPANQDALITAVGKGLVTRAQVKSFMNVNVPDPKTRITLRKRRRIVLAPTPVHNVENEIQKSVNRAIARSRGQLYL
tara:strand:- start:1684 stop:2394 length:711 start_codon:yes stop_codon:yes gene_type:complete